MERAFKVPLAEVDTRPDVGAAADQAKALADLKRIQTRRPLKPPVRHGIPTLYQGTLFRSRHEASFAAFFDELKIQWEYEPLDLAGYIPDFLLKYEKHPLLIEIKPACEDVEAAKLKIECSGWEHDVAILIDGGSNIVGHMRDDDVWDTCVVAGCSCGVAQVLSESGRHECRNCGGDRRELWFAFNPAPAWADAKNKTRWNPVERTIE